LRRQHAGAAVFAEALDDRLAAFQRAHDLTQGDRLGRAGKAETAAGTAPGFQEAGAGEVAHDLGQVVARDREFAGDLVRGEAALGLAGQPHQGPEPEIGEGGEAHCRCSEYAFVMHIMPR
jgi:hypothetical protein